MPPFERRAVVEDPLAPGAIPTRTMLSVIGNGDGYTALRSPDWDPAGRLDHPVAGRLERRARGAGRE